MAELTAKLFRDYFGGSWFGKPHLDGLSLGCSAEGPLGAKALFLENKGEAMCYINWLRCAMCVVLAGVWMAGTASAMTWDPLADYSKVTNPTGQWSYGRKWTPGGTAFDLLTVPWSDPNVPGYAGWGMGNVGHGGPAVSGGPLLLMWAKNNTNGLPVVRWTSPEAGEYSFDCIFTGCDGRGVDVNVYVAVNGTISFTDHIGASGETASYADAGLSLGTGDLVDFVVQWNGGVYSEYSWTMLGGTIQTVPEPASLTLLAVTACGALLRRRLAH